MKVEFEGTSKIKLEYKEGERQSKLIYTEVHLQIGENLNHDFYYDKEGSLTKHGIKSLVQCFVQGLNACIQSAHNDKLIDSAELMRYAIKELENAFIAVPEKIMKF